MLISCLYLLCATFSGEPHLEFLKLDQNCLSAIFRFTWSVWAFASTCTCCYTHITTLVRASFQSDCYTPEAFAFLHPFAFIAYFEGEWQFFSDWCVHVSTRGTDRSHNFKGRIYTLILLSACIHLWGCIISMGVAPWVAFARCVEPLPLLEGLAVF